MDRDWWRHAVVYQIYARSFADSDGDGIGDLPGVVSRLDHVADLGADAVWLNPFYRSPLVDGGYDISDHRDVDPAFGTLADFDRLVHECHARGLKVVVDVVPNHSSDQHPWFRAALAGRGRDRYVFRAGRDGGPPTDWRSWFHRPAWTQVADGQWYLHLFDPAQPDLNWANPEVRADFEQTLRFWADRGVDGFRVDVAHGLAKDLTEPLRDDGGLYPYQRHLLTDGTHPVYDRDEVHEIFRSWRTILDSYDPPKAAVAEAVEGPRRNLYARPDELGQAFAFDLLELGWDAAAWASTASGCLAEARAAGTTCTWVLSNHDVVRHVTRFALPDGTDLDDWKLSQGRSPRADAVRGLRRATALTLLMLALPGSAYLYMGEELGLPDVPDLPRDRLVHPAWVRSGGTKVGADGTRVPIPWTDHGPSLGFGPAPGWVPQPPEYATLSVERQDADPASTLNLYRAALRARREFAREERAEIRATGDVITVVRPGGWESRTNFGPVAVPVPTRRATVSSRPLTDGELPAETTVWLRP